MSGLLHSTANQLNSLPVTTVYNLLDCNSLDELTSGTVWNEYV